MSISDSSYKFFCQFYDKISSNTENLVFSPFSLFSVLCFCLGGASEDTEKELKKLLFVNLKEKEKEGECWIHEKMNSLIRKKKLEDQISFAFGIFTQEKITPFFAEFAENKYLAKAVETKFEDPGRFFFLFYFNIYLKIGN